tara:strand:+ start:49998 stop:50324 length:327 start_codon:yes stop_codon:yes gene_type:complete
MKDLSNLWLHDAMPSALVAVLLIVMTWTTKGGTLTSPPSQKMDALPILLVLFALLFRGLTTPIGVYIRDCFPKEKPRYEVQIKGFIGFLGIVFFIASSVFSLMELKII